MTTAQEGIEHAAILMMALGEEEAAAVFKHLEPNEVQRLGETIAGLRVITRDRVTHVIDRFAEAAGAQHHLVPDAGGYVSNVLKRALGDDKAQIMIGRIVKDTDTSGIDTLKWMDPPAIANLLRLEHPQVVAAVLVHLEPDQAAAVLKHFDEGHRNAVTLRIATLDSIQPEAMQDLNELLSQVLSGGQTLKPKPRGGPKVAAGLLNLLGNEFQQPMLAHLRAADEAMAQKVEDNMLIFDDLLKLNDKGIQAVLKEVQSDSLIVAMKGGSPALRERIFKNMSSRAAETLREDLDAKGPVKLSEVEAQQKEIVAAVRRLVEAGDVVMAGGGGEAYL